MEETRLYREFTERNRLKQMRPTATKNKNFLINRKKILTTRSQSSRRKIKAMQAEINGIRREMAREREKIENRKIPIRVLDEHIALCDQGV